MGTIAKIAGIIAFIATVIGLLVNVIDHKALFKKDVDISGEWFFEFQMKESTYSAYINKTTQYKMSIIQNHESISGKGETWKYDNEVVPYNEHLPLIIEGKFKDDTLICMYTLKGSKRETTGNFKAYYKAGNLKGTFSGTGADVKGVFQGNKNR